MTPHAGIGVEIARQIARVVDVAPEVQRHRWNGLHAHQLADFADDRPALLVPRLDRGTELAALHLAGHFGQLAIAADEGAAEVGATGDVAPPHLGCAGFFHLRRAPALHVFGQRRTGAAQNAHTRQVTALGRDHARLHAIGEVRRAGTEEGDLVLGHEAPQHGPVGLVLAAGRMAVVEADRRTERQPGQLRVPHDPTGRAVPVVALAEVVGAVAGADIVVQAACVHGEDDTAVPMHDRLGQAGGPARIEDPHRVVERQPFGREGVHLRIVARRGRGPVAFGRDGFCRERRAQHQQVLHARQRVAQLAHHLAAIDRLAAVVHAVGGDQHLGLDLPKAVDHRGGAHVGRTHAPHRTEAGAGQERDHGFGHVRQIGCNAVAALHPHAAQRQRNRSDLAFELGPRHLAHFAEFVVADDRRHAGGMRRLGVTQHLVRVVDAGTGKPDRPRHAALGQHRRVRRRRLHAAEVPDALPEGVELGHRPAPQGVVRIEGEAARVAQPVLIEADLGNERSCHRP